LHSQVRVQRWIDGKIEQAIDQVAEEQPVALSYHGIPHVVMLATPADLEDLAVGFTLSEALVSTADEIRSVELFSESGALEVRISIPNVLQHCCAGNVISPVALAAACVAETIEQAIRHPHRRRRGKHQHR
jgi:FdhD protein